MKKVFVKLKSISAYSQSKMYGDETVPKLNKESPQDYEKRTWRERCHYDESGNVYIPGKQFKLAIASAAKYCGMKIQGKAGATYTKHFESGILVNNDIDLKVNKDKIGGVTIAVPSDGIRGGSKRVIKTFPTVKSWEGTLELTILDDVITEDVFKYHINQAGMFIGVGSYRPRQNGENGRFAVLDITWQEVNSTI